MNTTPDIAKTAAVAATDQPGADAAPRVKFVRGGFAIDHPDPEQGEALMADALGGADRDAMDGLLRQLVKARIEQPHNPATGAPEAQS